MQPAAKHDPVRTLQALFRTCDTFPRFALSAPVEDELCAKTGRECIWVSARKVCVPELKGEKMWATQRKEANEAPGTG